MRHEKLHRTTVVVHKPFYAADLMLDDIEIKGIRADFAETSAWTDAPLEDGRRLPKASELPAGQAVWFNYFDFIDADRKPLDHDPRMEIVDIGDCPKIFFSKRVKARQTTAHDDEDSSLGSGSDSRADMESSKFGHEKSHICYLGAAPGVGPAQKEITQKRIAELEARLKEVSGSGEEVGTLDRARLTFSGRSRHSECAQDTQTISRGALQRRAAAYGR